MLHYYPNGNVIVKISGKRRNIPSE